MMSMPWKARGIAALVLAVTWLVGASLAQAGNSGFVSSQGGQFVLNGKTFRFVGTNAYFMLDAGTDGSQAHTDDMLAVANSLGFKVLRTWGFLDGTSAGAGLQPEAGVYNESAFRVLDYILYKADLAGVRLLLTLVNYWGDYGGMPQYVQWCAPGQSVDVFYTNANCKQLFKDYISHMLNRVNTYNGRTYKDDPTVFAWELANEPRSGDRTGSLVAQWAAEMAAYVKAIDRNHMVGVGDEGFDTTASGYSASSAYNNQNWLFDGTVGVSFTANVSLADIDFGSIHLYTEYWNLPPTAGSTWISDHIRLAKQLGKPTILGEFGYSNAPWSVFQPWMEAFENEKGGGAANWQIICASACANYRGPLETLSPSSSPVLPGMAQFASLANADQGSATPPPAPPPPPPSPTAPTFTVGPSSVSPGAALTGQSVGLSTSVTAGAPSSNIIVDLEVYNSSNVKVGQYVYGGQNFAAAGTTLSYNASWPGTTTPGTYFFKVGVFSGDWSTLYKWESAAGSITVQQPATPSFTVTSTTVSPTSVYRNKTVTISTNVKAPAAASALVDVELYNAAGTKVAQYACTKSFGVDQIQTCTWKYRASLPRGTYTVRIGVFTPDRSSLYLWVSNAGTVTVK